MFLLSKERRSFISHFMRKPRHMITLLNRSSRNTFSQSRKQSARVYDSFVVAQKRTR
ncbi:hypothetical protein GMA19_04179 [Paenibacillus polymyxa E681]|nr:hypothetical protein GE561_04181 [Paenibacillus polymyxa E681]QNV63809.1 hypothetical protein GMA19_04179 [Paenibacillus polymyxa E681]